MKLSKLIKKLLSKGFDQLTLTKEGIMIYFIKDFKKLSNYQKALLKDMRNL